MADRRLFVDMDGVLAKWNNNLSSEDELFEKGYYRDLEPVENVVKTIKELHNMSNECEVFILSKYLEESEFAYSEKKEWLAKYLPEINDEHIILVPYSSDKSKYIPGGIQHSDFLLDDYTKNLIDFKENGGQGIKLKNGINGTKGSWYEESINFDDEQLTLKIIDVLREHDFYIHIDDHLNKFEMTNLVEYRAEKNYQYIDGFVEKNKETTYRQLRQEISQFLNKYPKVDLSTKGFIFKSCLEKMRKSGDCVFNLKKIESNLKYLTLYCKPVSYIQIFKDSWKLFEEDIQQYYPSEKVKKVGDNYIFDMSILKNYDFVNWDQQLKESSKLYSKGRWTKDVNTIECANEILFKQDFIFHKKELADRIRINGNGSEKTIKVDELEDDFLMYSKEELEEMRNKNDKEKE